MKPLPQGSTVGLSLSVARIFLVLLLLVACGPPFMHVRFIEPNLDAVRYPFPTHLLPAEFLFLRYFGQVAFWLPIGLGILLGWSFFQPAATRLLFAVGLSVFLLFTSTYFCYTLLLTGALMGRHVY